MSLTSSDVFVMQPGESRLVTFNFGPNGEADHLGALASGETLSSVTGVTKDVTSPTTDLTIGTPAINTSQVTHADGRTTAANKGVQVRISDGEDGYDYRLEVEVVTSDSNTLIRDFIVQVREA